MFTLGQLADSEFDLLGAVSEEQFLGALDAANPTDKKKFFGRAKRNSRAVANPSGSRSRGEFERRINLLPKEIQQGLANQTLQAVDAAYYVVKGIGGSKVVKMFKDDDNKVVGLSNISSGKLETGIMQLPVKKENPTKFATGSRNTGSQPLASHEPVKGGGRRAVG